MNLKQILRELDDEQQNTNPESKKDESLKYEGKYFNGGFADGVKIEPSSDGKVAISISIYGGGEPKKIIIPATDTMSKILKAYEVGFKNNDKLGPSMEPEIDKYIDTLNQQISLKVMEAMREFDLKIKQILQQTIKDNNE